MNPEKNTAVPTFASPAAPGSGLSIAMTTLKKMNPDASTGREEEEYQEDLMQHLTLQSDVPIKSAKSTTTSESKLELEEDIIEAIKNGDARIVQNWIDTILMKGQRVDDFINHRKGIVINGNCIIHLERMTALHYAALYCQVQIVEKLLAANADPKCTNNSGENVLHVAVQVACESCAQLVFHEDFTDSSQHASHEKSAQPAGQTTHKDFPDSVQLASKEDSRCVRVIKLLLEKDRICVNIKTVDKGTAWTALQMAVELNLLDVVAVLLENGADPGMEELSDDAVRCSIALAAKHKDGKLLKLLLDRFKGRLRNFDINRKSGKLSALHIAVYFSCPKNAKLLIDHGADIRTKDNSRSKKYPIHYAYRSKTASDFVSILNLLKDSLNERDGSKRTLLHHAAKNNKLNYVRILVSKFKAEFKHKDKEGRLPIHYVVEQDSSFDDFKELVHLLNDKMDFKKGVNIQDNAGLTPLHLAIMQGHCPEYIKVLLDEEADPTIKSFKGKYKEKGVFHFAISVQATNDDFEKLMKILAKRNFDINDRDANRKTMLHYAIELEKFSKAHIIMDYPFTTAPNSESTANPSITDRGKKNCLHYAFINCCDGKLIRKFLERCEGLDDAVDNDGKRPSQYLCESSPISAFKALMKRDRIYPIGHYKEALTLRRYDIVKVLLLKGAELEGTTLMEVIKSENEDLAKILIRHAKDIITPLNSEFCGDQAVQSLAENTDIEDKTEDVSTGGNNQAGGDIQATNPGENTQAANTAGSNQAGVNIQASNAGGNIQTATVGGSAQTANTGGKNKKGTTPFRELIRQMPAVAYEALQRNTEVYETENKVIFRYPFVQQRKGNTSDAGNIVLENPLTLMVSCKRTRLLQHPVVRSFLLMKWRKFGFIYNIWNIFTYLLFLCSLTAFSLVVNNPLWNVCAPEQFQNRDNDTAPDSRRCGSIAHQVSTYIIAIFTILMALYQQLLEICQILYHRWKYFKILQNYVEFFVYILSFLFVFVFFNDCGCPKEWQWTVGIFAMFLAWTNVVFFSFKIPSIGIFVLIFYNIVKTFLKVALFSLILILGFSFILLMMFNSPNSQISAFSNFGRSFAKTATMVTGELDFDAIFGLDVPASKYVPIPFHEVSFFMWIIFLILIPIILNNMLTSLAVGDARDIMNEAELERLTLQVENLLEAEGILELFRIRKYHLMNDGYDYIHADVRRVVWRGVIFFIWGGKDFLKDIKDFTYEKRRIEEQEEMKVEAFDEVSNKQEKQHYQVIEKLDYLFKREDLIIEKLDQLFDLVKDNKERIKKSQKRP